MGEEIKQDGVVFVPTTEVDSPIFCNSNEDCPVFSLPVFADPDRPTNSLNNDKSDFYFHGDAFISAIKMTLQKLANFHRQHLNIPFVILLAASLNTANTLTSQATRL